ncbi:MAG: hypothetical protein J6S61_01730, partial [Elusimicrobiaceae bacterium]|nr:hypothetical protein [Elusimicrobiaceae bacterium]
MFLFLIMVSFSPLNAQETLPFVLRQISKSVGKTTTRTPPSANQISRSLQRRVTRTVAQAQIARRTAGNVQWTPIKRINSWLFSFDPETIYPDHPLLTKKEHAKLY